MGEKKTDSAYIPIQYPWSLDLSRDTRDPSAPSGHLRRLTNYIPKGQILETRKGITEFNFS